MDDSTPPSDKKPTRSPFRWSKRPNNNYGVNTNNNGGNSEPNSPAKEGSKLSSDDLLPPGGQDSEVDHPAVGDANQREYRVAHLPSRNPAKRKAKVSRASSQVSVMWSFVLSNILSSLGSTYPVGS